MSKFEIDLDVVDVDGAVREMEHEVAGDSRLDFLRKAGVAGGAAVGGGALLATFASPASGFSGRVPSRPFGRGDTGILNYALTLEYLEAAFYTEALNSGAITDPKLREFLIVVERDERAHVAFLKSVLKSKAIKKPKFDFKGTNRDQNQFKTTAQVLENTGVSAYFGQGANIRNPNILKAAVSILTVEARHAGAIGLINGGDPNISPSGAFDKPKSARGILRAVGNTGFIVG